MPGIPVDDTVRISVVKTLPLAGRGGWTKNGGMFLRAHNRWKNGKRHRYFSIVENRRIAGRGVEGDHVAQRTVLYLGEINDSQQASWRKTLDVFDGTEEQPRQLALFPDDRPVPPDALNALQVRLSEMKLRRPRSFGDCWLGCWLWQYLQLDRFWRERFEDARGEVPWEKVLELQTVHRLIDPGSEYRLHRQWFLGSAMDELLHVDFQAAGKDRLYRCLDRVLAHKDDLFGHLQRRWKDLFAAEYDVLLYDLTSTYFEGLCQDNPKALHGYSRDGRGDCRQVVIALIVTPQGLPLAYEVLPGNTSDRATLRMFLDKIESLYGKARRTWVMDRGIPSEELLAQMRSEGVDWARLAGNCQSWRRIWRPCRGRRSATTFRSSCWPRMARCTSWPRAAPAGRRNTPCVGVGCVFYGMAWPSSAGRLFARKSVNFRPNKASGFSTP